MLNPGLVKIFLPLYLPGTGQQIPADTVNTLYIKNIGHEYKKYNAMK